MSFWGFMTGQSSASAKVADGRLILSMPDAETPVVWMMNLTDAVTSVLRVEMDRQGFYVIRKHGGKGAAETVAVYRDRHPAVRALTRAAHAMEKARNTRINSNGQPVIVRSSSRLGRFFTIFLAIWFVLYLIGWDGMVLRLLVSPFLQTAQVSASAPAQTAPQNSPGANTAGVPLSADEFLKQQQGVMP